MIVLSLFLGYFLPFVAAFIFWEWLIGWLQGVTWTTAFLPFTATIVAAAIALILLADGLGGIMSVVAVILFWSFVIFGAQGVTAIVILVLAGALLFAGVAVAITRWRLVPARAPLPPKSKGAIPGSTSRSLKQQYKGT